MSHPDITIGDFIKFAPNSAAARVLRWQFASSFREQLEIIEESIDICYSHLIDTRGLNDDRSEDELNIQIANMLTMAGIPASHDQYINGHSDIVVRTDNGFMWLGEAKVHSDYGWLDSGFLQLSTRYGTAREGRDHGELIIYHRQGNSLNVLKEWKSRIAGNHPDIEISEDINEQRLYFRTRHACLNSGCVFNIRHSIIPLQHDPQK